MSAIDTINWVEELRKRAEPGVLDDTADNLIQVKAEDAVSYLFDAVPLARKRIASEKLSIRTFIRIVCDMVLRVLRNPEGYKSESDGTYSYTSTALVASGDLWIPDKDLALLRGPQVSRRIGSFNTAPQRGWAR